MIHPDFSPEDVRTLAQPFELMSTPAKRLVAPNRIAYQPMEGNDAASDGAPSDLTLKRYVERAEGRAGIDFIEAVAVSPGAKARGDQLMLTDRTAKAFEGMIRRYRSINPDTPLVMQLTHSGRFAEDPVSSYPLEDQEYRLLTDADMERIGRDFVAATKLAAEVGADGIDFKHCHGYLCGSLLGPANRARDGWSWGGPSIEQRSRFFLETFAGMRDAVPPDRFLYTVRVSAYEGIRGGFGTRGPGETEEDPGYGELKAFCHIAESFGMRLINVSSGVPDRTPLLVRQTGENPYGFFDHERHARMVKTWLRIPIVGSGYSYLKNGRNKLPGIPEEKNIVNVGARHVRDWIVDFVGLGRQSLSEPRFAALLFSGKWDEIKWDTTCNRCAVSLRSDIPAGCVTFEPYYTGRFKERVRQMKPSSHPAPSGHDVA